MIKRARWLVTKIYKHYTFVEQAKFKQEFILMNQKARQKGTSPVERDFYKLLNNANFGIGCRNNIDNCKLELICDEIGEISYIKKFDTIFGNYDNYSDFYCPQIMRDEVNQKYEARKQWYQAKKEEEHDFIDSLEARLKRNGKKENF